jgi:hypothetical protein
MRCCASGLPASDCAPTESCTYLAHSAWGIKKQKRLHSTVSDPSPTHLLGHVKNELRRPPIAIESLDAQPAASLTALASQLYTIDEIKLAVEVVERAWRRFPNDFRVNFSLGRYTIDFGGLYTNASNDFMASLGWQKLVDSRAQNF